MRLLSRFSRIAIALLAGLLLLSGSYAIAGNGLSSSADLDDLLANLLKDTRLQLLSGRKLRLKNGHNRITFAPDYSLALPKQLSQEDYLELSDKLQLLLNQTALADFLKTQGIEGKESREMFDLYTRFERKLLIYGDLRKTGYRNPELEKWLGRNQRERKMEIIKNYSAGKNWPKASIDKFLQKNGISATRVQDWLENLRIRNDVPVPESYHERMTAEQKRNDIAKIKALHSPLKTDLIKAFQPQEGNVFELPFVALNKSEARILGDQRIPKILKEGPDGIRFFIHPQSLGFFRELIKNHPLQYQGFYATAMSSSRSLIVWGGPGGTAGESMMKVGLDSTIGTQSRIVRADETLHAVMMSEGLSEIPQEYFEKIKLIPFLEPTAIVPRGFDSGLILKPTLSGKDLASDFVPLFSVFSSGNGGESQLHTLARKAGKDPLKFAKEDILGPMADSLAKLYADYGFIPEPHGQNLYVKVIDGKIASFGFSDLSGVSVDTELRNLRGLSNDFLRNAEKKFPDLYNAAYHNGRGSAYIDRGIEVHFKRLLIEGFNWDLAPDYKGIDITTELQKFASQRFRTAFKKAIGTPLGKKGTWAVRIRAAIEQQQRPTATCEKGYRSIGTPIGARHD